MEDLPSTTDAIPEIWEDSLQETATDPVNFNCTVRRLVRYVDWVGHSARLSSRAGTAGVRVLAGEPFGMMAADGGCASYTPSAQW